MLSALHAVPGACALALLAPAALPQFPVSVALPGDTALAPSSGTQEKPALACGSGHYLAVWEDGRSGLAGVVAAPDGIHPNRDVYAALLDAQGGLAQAAPIVVDQSPWDQTHARVAWNGAVYLVVWESTRPTASWRTQGIYAARVAATGQVLDATPLRIDDQDGFDERFPEVASDGSGFLVTWTDDATSTLDGAYVDGQGTVVLARTLVSAPSPLPTNVRLAHGGGVFAAVFERNFSSGIAARCFDAGLAQVGGEVSFGPGTRPGIASDGAGFFATWRYANAVRGTPFSAAGAVQVPGGAVLSGTLFLGDARAAVGFDGALWVVGFTNYGEAHVTQVDATGAPTAASPFAITTGNYYASDAAVAGGNGSALFAWTHGTAGIPYNIDAFDVHAVAIAPGGSGVPHPLTVSPRAQVFPALAGDASGGYLVAYQSRSTGAVDVLAQRLSPDGAVLDPQPILLASGGSTIGGTMDVAFDGARWMVVWTEWMPGGPPNLFRTFARRVGLDGTLLDPAPLDLLRGDRAAVAARGGEFLVATHFHLPPTQSTEIFHYKRVRGSDGAVLDASEVLISPGSGTCDVVGFDDRWLCVWGNVRGAFVAASGAVSPAFVAADAGLGSTGVVHPSLARNGDEALLAWEYDASATISSDVRARRIRKDGALLDAAAGAHVSAASHGQTWPRAAWYGSNYVVAFTDYRAHPLIEPGLGDVYAARVSPDDQVLDPAGLPAQVRWPVAEGRGDVAGGGGKAVLASCVLDGAPFRTWRVHLQVLADAPPPQVYCTAKRNSLGCLPQIGSSGTPSAAATSGFVVTCANVRNQKPGLLLYGTTGRMALPFQGGTLCVRTPVRRSVGVLSQGSPLPAQDCSGAWAIDMHAFAHGLLGGNPDPGLLAPGTVVDCQWWGRDPGFPAGSASSLSAGLEYVL